MEVSYVLLFLYTVSSLLIYNMVSEFVPGSLLKPLDIDSGDRCPAEAWEVWLQRFKIFLVAGDYESKPDEKKIALFLHMIGERGLHIFNSFGLKAQHEDKSLKLVDVFKRFDEHFLPKKNITFLRHKFFTRSQKEESIEDFVASLNKLSLDCEFKDLREGLVKDILILGLKNNQLKERLLRESDLKLDKAVMLCKAVEATAGHMREMDPCSIKEEPVFLVKKNFKKAVVCFKCKQVGHYANKCYKREKQFSNRQNVSKQNFKFKSHKNVNYVENFSEGDSDEFFVGVLGTPSRKDWCQNIEINKFNIKCKLDTGAQVNVISLDLLLKIGLTSDVIKKNNKIILKTLNGNLPVLGTILLRCFVAKSMELLEFMVISTDCVPLLGLPTIEKLNLISRNENCVNNMHLEVHNINVKNADPIVSKYKNIFSGIGKIECTPFHIKLKEDAVPRIDAPRRVPYALYDSVKAELKRMTDAGVIEKVDYPTEWVNSMVVTKKKNGSIRICLDPRHLNKFIIKPQFAIPTVEEIFSKFSGSKFYSILDCSSSFWMIPIDKESSDLCTFSTPFGRFKYLRLPFGLNLSSECFQSVISSIFENVEGVEPYIDDLIIFGKNEQEHDQRLENVLKIAQKLNIKFNSEKCIFKTKKVKFLGHIISQDGIHIDDDKVNAILKMPAPSNKKELETFLGAVNYLSKFIENCSEKTAILRELLCKSSAWVWDSNHEKCFLELKKCLTQAPVLKFYDVNKDVTISVDSSSYGIGCVLLQDGHPVHFSSRTLNSAQRNYAQIEREMLAILVGCLKFHRYIFNKKVTVETDHKALETLFKKPLAQVPARIQRMMLKVQIYDINVKYVPGKLLFLADLLSRSPLPLNEDSVEHNNIVDIDNDIVCQVDLIFQHLPFSSEKLEKIKDATEKDFLLSKLKNIVLAGWPNDKSKVDKELLPFWNFRDEINLIDNVLFKINAVIIPKSMQKEILQKVHEGHLGSRYCINRIRDKIFWPNIYSQIKDYCNNCFTCSVHQNNNSKEELLSHEITQIPWYKLGADLFQFDNKDYLLVVDYYSKFIEIAQCNGTSSKNVILHMKSIFARHGIPQILVSDNGPQFSSSEFKKFVSDFDFKHITSSPRYPKSNGEAEAAVKVIKRLLSKCKHDGSDPYIALLNLRNTPKSFCPSPSQLLYSRELNSKIPTNVKFLKPKIHRYNKNKFGAYRNNQKDYYNRNARNLESLTPNQRVLFKKSPEDLLWTPGVVKSKSSEPRSYNVADEKGNEYRRNRVHVSPMPVTSGVVTEKEKSPVTPECRQPVRPPLTPERNQPVVVESPLTTRIGRVVRPPLRFNDYSW